MAVATLNANHEFNYKTVIKKVIKSFIQPAPELCCQCLAGQTFFSVFLPSRRRMEFLYKNIKQLHVELKETNADA